MNKNKQAIIDEVMDSLQFEKIHKVMKFLNWKWMPENRIPKIYELRPFVRNLINTLIDKNLVEIQQGGFRVRKDNESIIVTFEVDFLEVELVKENDGSYLLINGVKK